jgi:hypothetical protein
MVFDKISNDYMVFDKNIRMITWSSYDYIAFGKNIRMITWSLIEISVGLQKISV